MSPSDNQAGSNGQLIPQEVAELAGELSEAEEESRRRRLARQIASLAGRVGHATKRPARARRFAAPRRVRTGTSAIVGGLRVGGQWLTAQALEMAPKVPIRNIVTLRQQY